MWDQAVPELDVLAPASADVKRDAVADRDAVPSTIWEADWVVAAAGHTSLVKKLFE